MRETRKKKKLTSSSKQKLAVWTLFHFHVVSFAPHVVRVIDSGATRWEVVRWRVLAEEKCTRKSITRSGNCRSGEEPLKCVTMQTGANGPCAVCCI